jgi:drug/metabolite transporter (DMT)-like permease
VISGAVVVPAFFLTSELDEFMRLPTEVLITQALVQGVMSGVVAVVGYAYAVRQLGASRAAIFTALVPASAMIIGIPTTAEVPNAIQIAGFCSSTAGLALVLSGMSHSASGRKA